MKTILARIETSKRMTLYPSDRKNQSTRAMNFILDTKRYLYESEHESRKKYIFS